MAIRTTGPGAARGRGQSDTYSWGRFWEVGVTLAGKCVRAGKEGVQTKLGESILFPFVFIACLGATWKSGERVIAGGI